MPDRIPFSERLWLTVPETCRYCHKGREWVKQMVDSGEFVAVQDGGTTENPRLKISQQSIKDWLEREAAKFRALSEGNGAA